MHRSGVETSPRSVSQGGPEAKPRSGRPLTNASAARSAAQRNNALLARARGGRLISDPAATLLSARFNISRVLRPTLLDFFHFSLATVRQRDN